MFKRAGFPRIYVVLSLTANIWLLRANLLRSWKKRLDILHHGIACSLGSAAPVTCMSHDPQGPVLAVCRFSKPLKVVLMLSPGW
jgi:hypothetical protein